jgi:hypothetical protein
MTDTIVQRNLTAEQNDLLEEGVKRHKAIDAEHRAGRTDAKKLETLIGLRMKKFAHEYTITHIRYGYDGYICARGKKWLKTGLLSKYEHDIGPITPKAFEPRDPEGRA